METRVPNGLRGPGRGAALKSAAFFLLLGLSLAACKDRGGGQNTNDAGVEVIGWHEPDYPQRVMITLNPHPERDRLDLPVIAELSHPGAHIRRDLRVHAENTDGTYRRIPSGAWSQPDGTLLEVGFRAEGLTPVNQERRFLVYYRLSADPEAWGWNGGPWAEFAELDKDENQVVDGFSLSGGGHVLWRDIRESDQTLRSGRRSDGNTLLDLTAPLTDGGTWTVAEGFANSYQLEDLSSTYPAQNAESVPISHLAHDSDPDDFAAAASVIWEGLDSPVGHDLQLTYRVFSSLPFMQVLLSATLFERLEEHRFSSANYHARRIYLADGYDRMVSDTRGEEDLARVWDTAMQWLVVYDSATNQGFGLFMPYKGVIRADEDEGGVSIYDSYGHSSGARTSWRYLWMASPSKDEIVDLFDAMKPGVRVGQAENQHCNILKPLPDDFFFPGDSLEVVISSPGGRRDVSARLLLPDASELPVALQSNEHGLLHRSASPLLLQATHPTGTWTLVAESLGSDGTITRQVDFQFRLPEHPKLLFDAADLPGIVARKDHPDYAEIWAAMLHAAERYDDPIPSPGLGLDIRSYGERLINLALIQLVDPSQAFEDMLWSYFFAMLRYPNWHEEGNPFNNHDLTVGHFLAALALTYDWHYDRLTPAQRQETRRHLMDVVDAWIHSSWLRTYRDIDHTRYGTVTNNHYWINHMGVAAAAFVLSGEMPEAKRAVWIDHLEENLATILSVLEPDGTSNEGVAYHSYGQINLFVWLDMRDRALGGSTANAIPWFAQSVLWCLYSVLPGGIDNYGGVANFGDCPTVHYQSPRTIQSWLADRVLDPEARGIAQWIAQNLQRPRPSALSYLWYNPAIEATPPEDRPTWRLFPNKGIFAWRSSWADDATYFSQKCGSYFGGHEQPDAGHFILHRAGVPYIIDLGYSYLKVADEHNLMIFDGLGQHGDGQQWMGAVHPDNWGKVLSSLADNAYFNLVTDPTPMLRTESVSSWHREVVGLGEDIFLVRDTVSATAMTHMDWLLHSYRSDPPSSVGNTFTYAARRTENPWTEVAEGRWEIRPQDEAPILHLADLSWPSWSPVLEPSLYVPEQNPDTREYNVTTESFAVGYRLRRSLSATEASSLVALWFGDHITALSVSTAWAEAVRLTSQGQDVALVIWPSSGSVTAFGGFDVSGTMGGRRHDAMAYFGRELTYLSEGSDVLVSATAPLDLFARLEHDLSAAQPGLIVTQALSAATVSLHCPTSPTSVTRNGTAYPFDWAGSILTLDLSPGEHRIEVR